IHRNRFPGFSLTGRQITCPFSDVPESRAHRFPPFGALLACPVVIGRRGRLRGFHHQPRMSGPARRTPLSD
ncbi:hypothetical protein PspLS_03700, partial [Pyricularia sp. CBS 133598]